MGWLGAASIAGRLILGALVGAAIASELSSISATRARNARLTEIPYTPAFPLSDRAPIAVQVSTLPAITYVPSVTGGWWLTGS